MYFKIKFILKNNCYDDTKYIINFKCDVYQFIKSTNLIDVMCKTIISLKNELTKNVVLGLIFFIIWFYYIEYDSKFEC